MLAATVISIYNLQYFVSGIKWLPFYIHRPDGWHYLVNIGIVNIAYYAIVFIVFYFLMNKLIYRFILHPILFLILIVFFRLNSSEKALLGSFLSIIIIIGELYFNFFRKNIFNKKIRLPN